jgi:hypothetical protein
MLPLVANFWSLGLLAVAAEAYVRRAGALYWVSLSMFAVVATAATWFVWSPHSPLLASALVLVLLVPGVLGYVFYLTDRAFACFTSQMTYTSLIASVLWPILVFVNYLGMLI